MKKVAISPVSGAELAGDIAKPETMCPGPEQFSRRGLRGAATLSEAKTGHKFTGFAAMPAWK
jgi:hypothetical protein